MNEKDFCFVARCFRMQRYMADTAAYNLGMANYSKRVDELARMARYFALEMEATYRSFPRKDFMLAAGFPESESGTETETE